MQVCVGVNGFGTIDNRDAYFFQAIHPQSIVVSENVDAIRAALDTESDGRASIAKSAPALGLSHL